MINVSSYDQATSAVTLALNASGSLQETVALEDSLYRILAENVVSFVNIPAFRRSSVDGYALNAQETYGAMQSVPAHFTIVGSINIGDNCTATLAANEAFFVPTGAMLPKNATAVVMYEHTETNNNDLFVFKPIKIKENVVDIGEDVCENCTIAKTGDIITPTKIGAFAAIGAAAVKVVAKKRIAVISTGDELVPHSVAPSLGQVRNINSPLLGGLVNTPYSYLAFSAYAKDNLQQLIETLANAIDCCDIILISGGSSVGKKDFTEDAIRHFTSEILINGIALKPGKPTIIAKKDNKLIYGLPGHPMASAMVYLLLYEKPYLKTLGAAPLKPHILATASVNFPSESGRTTAIPVALNCTDGEYYCAPLFSKSGLISVIAAASGYALIAANTEGIYKGEKLEVTLF